MCKCVLCRSGSAYLNRVRLRNTCNRMERVEPPPCVYCAVCRSVYCVLRLPDLNHGPLIALVLAITHRPGRTRRNLYLLFLRLMHTSLPPPPTPTLPSPTPHPAP